MSIQTKLGELNLIQMDNQPVLTEFSKVVNHCFDLVIVNPSDKVVNIFCSGFVNQVIDSTTSSSSILMLQATALAERNHSYSLSLPRQLRKVGDQPKNNYLGGSESAFTVNQ